MGVITTLIKASLLLFCVSGFSLAGVNKLTDQFAPEMHRYLQEQAVRWYSVIPNEPLNLKQWIQATDYLPFIGYTELVGALFLILPGFHSIGTLILLGVSSGAALTHMALKESPLPPALLGLGVLALYILRSTTNRKHKVA
jgi:hypothetical protein